MRRWCRCLIVTTGLLSLPGDSVAESAKYDLPTLIQRALQHNARIMEGRAEVDEARAQLREATSAFILPRLRLESVSGLVPDAEGDIYNPPSDTSGVRALGPFARAELEFVQPLYTFGLLSNLRRAARAGVDLERAYLAGDEVAVTHEVKELYFGLLLVQDLSALARRLREELAQWEDEVTLDNPDIPLSAPYKLELALLELDHRSQELDDALRLAHGALAYQVGLPQDEHITLEEDVLRPTSVVLPPVEQLYSRALRQRPEWRQLQAGLAARHAQERAARSAYYPQIFVAGGIRYAIAPGRTDQHNPFVKDEFNLFNGGLFLGIRQSFEWGLLGADLDKARAKRRQLEAVETTAAQGIRVEVRQAYDAFALTQSSLVRTRKARNLTREWIQLAQDEYDLDPGSVKELISAFEALAGSEEAYYRAMYEANLSLADLERTIGGGPLTETAATP
jgi:outer membrane protein